MVSIGDIADGARVNGLRSDLTPWIRPIWNTILTKEWKAHEQDLAYGGAEFWPNVKAGLEFVKESRDSERHV
jgi:hypothetical protein